MSSLRKKLLNSIKTKFIFYVVLMFVAVLGVSLYFISEKVKEELEIKTDSELTAVSDSYGNKISIDMQSKYNFVRNLSDQMVYMKGKSRKEINYIYKELLEKNPDLNGIYIMYERNAFDGKDELFINDHENGSNIKGLFEPYWQRINGSLFSKIVDADETGSEYYAIPKATLKTSILEPYYDQGVLMTSYVAPLLENQKFIGIVGIDVAINDINASVENIKILNSGYISIISKNGILIADKFKEGLGEKNIQKVAEEIEQPVLASIVEKIQKGESGNIKYFDNRLGKQMKAYYKQFGAADWGIITVVPEEEIFLAINEIVNSIIIVGVIALLFLSIFVYFFAVKFTKPINCLVSASEKVINNDYNINVQVKTGDELEKLGNVFNDMVRNIRESFNEIKLKSELAENKTIEAEDAKRKALDQAEYLSSSTQKILHEMEKFSEGDLTVSLPVENDDDIGKLSSGFNKSVENIGKLISSIQEAVQATASASSQISSSSEEMAAGAQEQSAQVTEIASAVEEMTRTIIETTKNASIVADNSKLASDNAKKGAQKIDESKKGMDRIVASASTTGKIISSLAQKSDQIGEITQVIDDIADQTNLLALNAAIEAARAGEQGRGFAVVADEVRKLAERTTKATKEIADTIRTIQQEAKEADRSMVEAGESVKHGMELTGQVAEVLDDILKVNDKVSDMVNQVAAASEEQSATAEEISKNIESISSVTQQSAAGTQQIARAAEDLNQLTNNLQILIERFRLDNKQTYAGQKNKKLLK